MCLCDGMPHVCRCPWRPEERFPGVRITVGCMSPNVCDEK